MINVNKSKGKGLIYFQIKLISNFYLTAQYATAKPNRLNIRQKNANWGVILFYFKRVLVFFLFRD